MGQQSSNARALKKTIDEKDFEGALQFVTRRTANVRFHTTEFSVDSAGTYWNATYQPLHYVLDAAGAYSNFTNNPVSDAEAETEEAKSKRQEVATKRHAATKLCFALLEAGASVHARAGTTFFRYNTGKTSGSLKNTPMNTPLHYAVKANLLEVATELIRRGANVEVKDDTGKTAIFHAVKSLDTFMFLKQNGAKLDLKDNNGNSLLHAAAAAGNPEVVRILLSENKGSVSTKNKSGETPLHQVSSGKTCSEIVRMLIAAGAAKDETDNQGWTALHTAARYDRKEMAKALLQCGANPLLLTKDGKTALALSLEHGRIEIAELLTNGSAVASSPQSVDVKLTDEERSARAAVRDLWDSRVKQGVAFFKLHQSSVGPDFVEFVESSFETWGFEGLLKSLQGKYGEEAFPPAWLQQLRSGTELGTPPEWWTYEEKQKPSARAPRADVMLASASAGLMAESIKLQQQIIQDEAEARKKAEDRSRNEVGAAAVSIGVNVARQVLGV